MYRWIIYIFYKYYFIKYYLNEFLQKQLKLKQYFSSTVIHIRNIYVPLHLLQNKFLLVHVNFAVVLVYLSSLIGIGQILQVYRGIYYFCQVLAYYEVKIISILIFFHKPILK